MKKNLLKLLGLLFTIVMCTSFSSCGGDDNDDPTVPEKPINPVEPSKDNAKSSLEQKEYLETVALEFMDMMPSSDFREMGELAKFIKDNYCDRYNWNNVENWANDAFEAAREAVGAKSTESKTKWGVTYNYIYTNYNAVLLASNFTGHFTARNGRWFFEKADDLQFFFTDKHGQECVLKLETGGNVKKVYLLNIEDMKWSDYDSHDYYYDRTKCAIGVPERIVVSLTQGSSLVVRTTINIDLGSITNEELDISKNSITVSALVELNNGYKFDVSRVVYTANTKASVAFTMSKNGTPLVTLGVSADLYDIPSVNVSAFSSKSFNGKDYDFDSANGKNAYVKLDILGKVQIQGTLLDVRKYIDYLEEANNNNRSESTYKSYINQANSIADINLFYDGNNVKQAAIKLEPFANEKWNGRTYWETEPVIFFYDGSLYSTFEAFFNEKDFKKVVETFKTLANKYADIVDERIKW